MLKFFGPFVFINVCDLSQGIDSGGSGGRAWALIFESKCGPKGQEKIFRGDQPPSYLRVWTTKLSTIASLRSKRFHVVSEQRTRNESQTAYEKWLSFLFARRQNRKSHSPSFLSLSLLQNHTEMFAMKATQFHETTTGDIHPVVQPCYMN